MSTFKSTYSDNRFEFTSSDGLGFGLKLWGEMGPRAGTIALDPAHAPAIALAALQAAGVPAADPLNSDRDFFGGDGQGDEYAVMWLRKFINHTEANAAVAAEEAELAQEPRELLQTFQEVAAPSTLHDTFKAVARRARELATERNTK